MNTARYKRTLEGFAGIAKLYQLTPPIDTAIKFVVVSATDGYSGPETYIFPADRQGRVTHWGELAGSFRGSLDHEKALRNAGYTVA